MEQNVTHVSTMAMTMTKMKSYQIPEYKPSGQN